MVKGKSIWLILSIKILDFQRTLFEHFFKSSDPVYQSCFVSLKKPSFNKVYVASLLSLFLLKETDQKQFFKKVLNNK